MGVRTRLAIVAVLVVAVLVILVAKRSSVQEPGDEGASSVSQQQGSERKLPRLVDVGAKQCIPCRMMAPILEQLKREQAGTIEVEFVDVWENPDAGRRYDVRVIPTQIFYDADGKEFYRHEGFLPKEAILKIFREHGIEPASQPPGGE